MLIYRASQVAVAGLLCTSLALAQTPQNQRVPERGIDQQQPQRQQQQQQQQQQPPRDNATQRPDATQQQDPRRSGTSGQAVPRSTLRPEFDDGGQYPTGDFFLVRATQIVGMEVRDATGQSLVGTIQDLLITPNYGWPVPLDEPLESGDSLEQQSRTPRRNTSGDRTQGAQPGLGGRQSFFLGFDRSDLRFALIQVDSVETERVAVVPWDLLQFQGSYFVLGFAFERILQAPSVVPGDPRVLQDDQWIEQVHNFYQDDMRRIQQRSGPQQLQPGQQQQRNAPPATGTQRQTPQTPTPRRSTSPPQSERPQQPSQGGSNP